MIEKPEDDGLVVFNDGTYGNKNAEMILVDGRFELITYRGYYDKTSSDEIETLLHEVVHGTLENIKIKLESIEAGNYSERIYEKHARKRAKELHDRYSQKIFDAMKEKSK